MISTWRFLVLGLSLACAGCGSIPPTSVPQLSRIDPGKTDPAALRLAVSLPTAVRPNPGDVAMEVTLRVEGETERRETFALVSADGETDRAGLPATSAEYATYAFRLDPAETARLEKLRDQLAAAKAARRKGSITIGIHATAFCRASSAPVSNARMTTYLRSAETASYVVLIRNVELWGSAEAPAAIAALDPC